MSRTARTLPRSRGTEWLALLVALVVGTAVAGCGKKSLSAEESERLRDFVRGLNAIADANDDERALLLAQVLVETLAADQPTMALLARESTDDRAVVLLDLGFACGDAVAARLREVSMSGWGPILHAECGAQRWGLDSKTGVYLSAEWFIVRRAGELVARLYDRADSELKRHLDSAFEEATFPLPLSADLAGAVALPEASAKAAAPAPRGPYLVIDKDGSVRSGVGAIAVLTPSGARLTGEGAPFPGEPVTAEELPVRLASLRADDGVAAADHRLVEPDEPPAATADAAPTAPATAGRRASGQYAMKKTADDAELHMQRQEAIEAARKAGVLGLLSSSEPPVTPDEYAIPRAGIEAPAIGGPVLDTNARGVGQGGGFLRRQSSLLVLADRELAATQLVQRLSGAGQLRLAVSTPDQLSAMTLAVELIDRSEMVAEHSSQPAPVLVVSLGDESSWLSIPASQWQREIPRGKSGGLDLTSIAREVTTALDDPRSLDIRRNVAVHVSGGITVDELVDVIEQLIGANATHVTVIAAAPAHTLAGAYGSGYAPGQIKVQAGGAAATGHMDKEEIRAAVRGKVPRVKYCYEKELLVTPGLEGTVTATWTILPDGSVTDVGTSGVDNAPLLDCIAAAIRSLKFPKSQAGSVQVRYPFTLATR